MLFRFKVILNLNFISKIKRKTIVAQIWSTVTLIYSRIMHLDWHLLQKVKTHSKFWKKSNLNKNIRFWLKTSNDKLYILKGYIAQTYKTKYSYLLVENLAFYNNFIYNDEKENLTYMCKHNGKIWLCNLYNQTKVMVKGRCFSLSSLWNENV